MPLDSRPKPAVGIEHHLYDGRIIEKTPYRGAERRAQHARAARDHFRLNGMDWHRRPQ